MNPDYDLMVVGGGIHGVGIAQAAAAAGYSVAVLEKTGWASGTSSRSSKLIHGGLRYLQTGQLALVRRCLQERALLLKLAPQLVRMNQFHIPVYADSHYRPWQLQIGLSLYRWLAGDNGFRSNRISVADWQDAALSGLNTEQLQAVFCYQDAQTDDRLLTLAVKHSAAQLGAEFYCPAELLAARQDAQGVVVEYRCQGVEQQRRAQVLVVAAGPWVTETVARIEPAQRQLPVNLVAGSHLVLKAQISQQCFYLEASDQRVVFVLPWQGKTLVGTTERRFEGDPGQIVPADWEVDYLLATVARYFPAADLALDTMFAGVRVLPASRGKAFFSSRDTQLVYDDAQCPRVVTLYGGKLTDYRAVSEQLVNALSATLGPRQGARSTRDICLHPAPADDVSPD